MRDDLEELELLNAEGIVLEDELEDAGDDFEELERLGAALEDNLRRAQIVAARLRQLIDDVA